jgi:hypothetical protein
MSAVLNSWAISDYITKKYPQSCVASNSSHDADECRKFFHYEKLKWCGCGSPEDALKPVQKILRILNEYRKFKGTAEEAYNEKCKMFEREFGVNSIYDNELLLCLAYTLDAAGLTEHGSSIGGAWISDEGEMFLYLLDHTEWED